MRISTVKSDFSQAYLFERPVRSAAEFRNVAGDLAERLTAALVGGVRHRTDGRADYCPDVSLDGCFWESKAVGRGRQMIIYTRRLAKDAEFNARYQLTYAVWHHRARLADAGTIEAVERAILLGIRAVYLIPFMPLHLLCLSLPSKVINTGYGRSRADSLYGRGTKVPLALLRPWLAAEYPMGVSDVSRVSPTGRQPEILDAEDAPDPTPRESMSVLRRPAAVGAGVPSHQEGEVEPGEGLPSPTDSAVYAGLGQRYRSPCLWDLQQEERIAAG